MRFGAEAVFVFYGVGTAGGEGFPEGIVLIAGSWAEAVGVERGDVAIAIVGGGVDGFGGCFIDGS